MPLLIRNGEIVTASDRYHADIYCENETITQIGKNLEAPSGARVIDAGGKYIFPGFIDPHVHIYLPFMGTFAKDTYSTASKAALVGGTTTFIDMCVASRGEDPAGAFATWQAQSEGKSACDYTYHLGVSRFDSEIEKQLRGLVREGLASFKVFLAYKGAFGIQDHELFQTLRLAKELGVITCAHCENETLIAELQQKLLAEGKTGPEWHHESRPPQVEADGVHHLCTFAGMHDASVYIVHLSCREALEQALAARDRGVRVAVETLIQYLLLDKTWAEKPDFEGAKYVMSPPLRDARNQSVLWNALRNHLVDTVATDHCPFDFATQKPMGKDNFTKIPNGIPALEDRVNLLYTYGVKTGKMDLHRFVDTASTRAAKLFGLFPRKGAVQVGSDADLVIYHPGSPSVISAKTQSVNNDYSGFEGVSIAGRPEYVTVRGEVAVDQFKFTGTYGRGQFLRREPSHF